MLGGAPPTTRPEASMIDRPWSSEPGRIARPDGKDEHSGDGGSSGDARGVWPSLESYLEEISAQTSTPRWFLSVSVEGQRRHFSGGVPDQASKPQAGEEDPAFRLTCVCKPLLSGIAIDLAQAAHLDIDTAIGRYLPDFASHQKGSDIRIRHLMDQTAGYATVQLSTFSRPAATNRVKVIDAVKSAPQVFVPGTVFSYEESANVLLGYALQSVVGVPAPKLLQDKLFASFGRGTVGAAEPLLQDLRLRCADLLTIGESMLLPDSRSSGHAGLFTHQTLRFMQSCTRRIPRTSSGRNWLPVGYGCGLSLFNKGYWGKGGYDGEDIFGFYLSSQERVAVVLGIRNASNLVFHRSFVEGVLDRVGVTSITSDQPVAYEFDSGEIQGTYVGHGLWSVDVELQRSKIWLKVRARERLISEVEGAVSDSGDISFASTARRFDPTFFRDPGSGDPSLMLGNCALRKTRRSGCTTFGMPKVSQRVWYAEPAVHP